MKRAAVGGAVLGVLAACLVHCKASRSVPAASDAGAGIQTSVEGDASGPRAATVASQTGSGARATGAATAVAGTSEPVLRAGWLGTGSTLFVVTEHGAYTFDGPAGGAAAPHAPRCALPARAAVLGVSSGGRVALALAGEEKAGDVALLEVASCALKRTSVRASQTDPGVRPGLPPAGRLSDDGSRMVLEGGSDETARVFDLPGGALHATCTSRKASGGADQWVGLSGDGAALVWSHDRVGTWVQPVAGCAGSAGDVVTPSDAAFVSPHRRFVVVCPYHPFAGDETVAGYTVNALPGSRVVGHIAAGDLAADDLRACSGASAFSPDDGRFALAHAGRVHVFALGDGHEALQIDPVTLRKTLGEDAQGLAFSPAGDALAVWGAHRVVAFGLSGYEAYAHAGAAEKESALKKALRATVDLRSPR